METITLKELRKTTLYRNEITRPLRELFNEMTIDEKEIIELGNKFIYMDKVTEEYHGFVEFAKAILEKAK